MSVQSTINALLQDAQHLAKSETVFGEPITAGDVTLIPVSKISMGFAAGGSGKDSGASGTGGGIQITPVALVSVHDGAVQIHSLENSMSDMSKIVALAPDLISSITKKLKKDTK